MSMFFIVCLVNDHSKYCIHHGNCNYCVNQKRVIYQPRNRDNHDSSFYDQKSNWDQRPVHHPISHFLEGLQ